MVARPHINRGLAIFIFQNNFPHTRGLGSEIFALFGILGLFYSCARLGGAICGCLLACLGGNFCN
jgi:hypothetical protein